MKTTRTLIDQKDHTEYRILNGTYMGKGPFALHVIKHYVEIHPQKTFEEYCRIFNPLRGGRKYPCIEKLEKATRKRYFIDEPLKSIDNIAFVVDRDWAITNIQPVIDFANREGYNVESRDPYLAKD